MRASLPQRSRFLISGIVAIAAAGSATAQETPEARVARIVQATPLIDGHNDFLSRLWLKGWTADSFDMSQPLPGFMTDLPRLVRGHVGAQFWAVFVPVQPEYPHPYASVQAQLTLFRQMIARNPKLGFAKSAADIVRLHRAGRIASLLGIESGHIIENSLANLRALYAAGARYMTLTHWRNTDWADASTDTLAHGGLTAQGEAIVHEMNRLGMMVDLSHVSDSTMWDALRVSRAPVIYSHSSLRHFSDHPRNVPDDILKAVAKHGGLVMINFDAWFIHQPTKDWYGRREKIAANFDPVRRMMGDSAMSTDSITAWERANPVPLPTIREVADHFQRVKDLVGVDHVGFGSDFDGTDYNPVGLDDVGSFPNLLVELARRGWTDQELAKVAGGNLLRVFRAVEAVARHR